MKRTILYFIGLKVLELAPFFLLVYFFPVISAYIMLGFTGVVFVVFFLYVSFLGWKDLIRDNWKWAKSLAERKNHAN